MDPRLERWKASALRAWELLREIVSRTRSDFEAKSKFQRWRIIVVGIFLADLVISPVLALALRDKGPEIEAWFQSSFPRNLVVVRNLSGDDLEDVELILDQEYRRKVGRIDEDQTTGFEVEDAFLGRDGFGPPSSYRPSRLQLKSRELELEVPLETRGAK